jgi:DNA-binding transcriptional LysR family regulator
MQTRFLESFVAVVESGSLAAAARRLNITAAGVAQRVRSLEADMGFKLLARSGRLVGPTESGAAILDHARAILRETRDMANVGMGGQPAGGLRIGAIATAMIGMIPDVLRVFASEFPQIDLFLEPGSSQTLYHKVLDGELDAAVVVEPYFPVPKACRFSVIREEAFVLIAPISQDGVDPRKLIRMMPFIRYDRQQWGARVVNDYLKRERLRPKDRFELDSLEAIAVMVDKGLGVALVPEWKGPRPEGLALVEIPLEDPAPFRRVGIVWLANRMRADLVRRIVEAGNAK